MLDFRDIGAQGGNSIEKKPAENLAENPAKNPAKNQAKIGPKFNRTPHAKTL